MGAGYQPTYTASTLRLTVAQLRRMLKQLPDSALIRLTEHPGQAEHAADGITLTLVEHFPAPSPSVGLQRALRGEESPRDIVTLSPRTEQP